MDVARKLESHRAEIEACLVAEFQREFPGWTSSLMRALESFEEWLSRILSEELARISVEERTDLLEPLKKVEKQVFRTLQAFRDQQAADHAVSGRTLP